jgi:Holliday junction resolvasome RuvABC endonuclease subunit
MRILSFDQSSNLSGYCLFDGDIIDSGIIDRHKIKDRDIRIAEMSVAIYKKIDELNPDLVVIENIQNQSNIPTVILLARLQGMILGYCYVHKIRTEILASAKWRSVLGFKQGAGIKRDELKQQAIDYIANEFLVDDIEIDEGEAICIAIAADKLFGLDDEI